MVLISFLKDGIIKFLLLDLSFSIPLGGMSLIPLGGAYSGRNLPVIPE